MNDTERDQIEVIRTALRDVIDPELGINVVDLGMIREIRHQGDSTTVYMVLTTMTCPFWELFVDQVRSALDDVPGVGELEVRYDPRHRWTPDMLSDEARWELEITGLLPTNTWLTKADSTGGR